MQITNRHKLDDEFVAVLQGGVHERVGDVSVTRLLTPLQQVLLMRRHSSEIKQDATDLIWMFIGQMGHQIIDSVGSDGGLTEETFAIRVDETNITPIAKERAMLEVRKEHKGIIVSGRIDLFTNGELTDYKTTKVWSHIYGSRLDEWRAQLSLYRLMLHMHGIDVKGAHILEFLLDWNQGEALRKHDYPKRAIYRIPIELWTIESTKQWIVSHVKQYLHYLDVPDEKLLPCSAEERWARPEKWAVYKNKTVKKASRLLGSEKEAYEYISEHLGLMGAKPVVKFRRGISTRCERYCLVAPWCAQRRAELEEDEKNGQNQ